MREDRHQSIKEILETSSPEQKILWESIMLICGENAAVRKLHYTGSVASEFSSYFTTKLYLCYSLTYSSSNVVSNAGGQIYFADQANAWFHWAHNNSAFFNNSTLATWYVVNNVTLQNFWFSRHFIGAVYTHMSFTGYRIIY